MELPRYWAKSSQPYSDQRRGDILVCCWRWSASSLSDARRDAEHAVRAMVDRLQAGEWFPSAYDYGAKPLREELLQELRDRRGEVVSAVTRNYYGAKVLNTAEVMFADIDKKSSGLGSILGSAFRALFGGKAQKSEHQQLDSVKEWAAQDSRRSMRIYQTHSGYRLLLTHEKFDPSSEGAVEMLNSFGSDPLYVRLCRSQSCFRARLSPKHWRIRVSAPPNRFPWENAQEEARYREWLYRYEQEAQQFAVCRFLESIGHSVRDDAIAQVVDLHDRDCQVHAEKQLA